MPQTMPTSEQLKAFADQLPPIYRDILAAFPGVDPDRAEGGGYSTSLLFIHLQAGGRPYSTTELMAALERLEERGFLEIDDSDLVVITPTILGEQLIAALTGKKPKSKVTVPDLPKPTW